MEHKLLSDRVLIKPFEAETKTELGIYIPDTAKERPLKGEVILVGPGKDGNLMTVEIGDTVLYSKYSGNEVSLGGESYLLMNETDIFMIIKE